MKYGISLFGHLLFVGVWQLSLLILSVVNPEVIRDAADAGRFTGLLLLYILSYLILIVIRVPPWQPALWRIMVFAAPGSLVISGLLLHPHTLVCFAMVGMMGMFALVVWAGATIVRAT